MIQYIVYITLFASPKNADVGVYKPGLESYRNRNSADSSKPGKTYVSTGFYFVSKENEGVKMKREQSDEIYNISKTPFVSVKNFLRARIRKVPLERGSSTALLIVLDNKGTKDFENASGNPLYSHFAVVVANKLLYVLENTAKIDTGILNIIVDGFSDFELKQMMDAINAKR